MGFDGDIVSVRGFHGEDDRRFLYCGGDEQWWSFCGGGDGGRHDWPTKKIMAMAIAFNSSGIMAVQPRKLSKRTSYMRCSCRLNSRISSVKPLRALVKKNHGVVGNKNLSYCFGPNLFSGDLNTKSDKVKCHWKKMDTVEVVEKVSEVHTSRSVKEMLEKFKSARFKRLKQRMLVRETQTEVGLYQTMKAVGQGMNAVKEAILGMIRISDLPMTHNQWLRYHIEQPKFLNDTSLMENVDSNATPDSSDMCNNEFEDDQNDDDHEDECVVLANLTANLKLDINKNKMI
ncbi:hypothetical protein Tco_0259629 [Tanacetum coccineum]